MPEEADDRATEPRKAGTDWIRLASSAPAVLGFLGLIVYAVVRVGHDAFYARFGVTAEEVGLSQATILGRAALNFVFFLTTAIALIGVSAVIARPTAALGARGRGSDAGRFWARAGVAFLVLAACMGFGGVIVAGFERAWQLAVAIGIVIPLVVAASVGGRLLGRHRAVAGTLFFGLLAAWSASVAYVVASRPGSSPGAASLSAPARWLLFGFCVLAAATASVSLLRQFELSSAPADDTQRRQLYLTTLTVLALLPLALAFFAPGVGRFVTDANARTAAAFAMWAVLFGFVILGFQVLQARPGDQRASVLDVLLIVSLASVFAGTALYLASVRGLDLANQALAGNRITQSGFGMFSVRSDIVCLEPITGSLEDTSLPRKPMIYLGHSANNMLVLFDVERRERVRLREAETNTDIGAPERIPVRIPAADVVVQVAKLNAPSARYLVPIRGLPGKWIC